MRVEVIFLGIFVYYAAISENVSSFALSCPSCPSFKSMALLRFKKGKWYWRTYVLMR